VVGSDGFTDVACFVIHARQIGIGVVDYSTFFPTLHVGAFVSLDAGMLSRRFCVTSRCDRLAVDCRDTCLTQDILQRHLIPHESLYTCTIYQPSTPSAAPYVRRPD
jgi:hypothetical protein